MHNGGVGFFCFRRKTRKLTGKSCFCLPIFCIESKLINLITDLKNVWICLRLNFVNTILMYSSFATRRLFLSHMRRSLHAKMRVKGVWPCGCGGEIQSEQKKSLRAVFLFGCSNSLSKNPVSIIPIQFIANLNTSTSKL